jgi:hypothetical protein
LIAEVMKKKAAAANATLAVQTSKDHGVTLKTVPS